MPTSRPARTGRGSRARLRPVPDPTTSQAGQPATPAAPPAPAPSAGPAVHGPYGKPPRGRAILAGERATMLAEALQGVRLGAFDRHALEWLCRWADTPTFLALLGILQRAHAHTSLAAVGEGPGDG
jgi:hypothetical protein